MTKRVNLTLPDVVYAELEAWAKSQRHPTANLAALTIVIAKRKIREALELLIY
jgi:hypothetical protein